MLDFIHLLAYIGLCEFEIGFILYFISIWFGFYPLIEIGLDTSQVELSSTLDADMCMERKKADFVLPGFYRVS